jgi:hypothetical protein
MKLWVISAECGDYYCGCGLGHLIGVCTDYGEANALADEARRSKDVYVRKDGNVREYTTWMEVEVQEITAGVTVDSRALGSFEDQTHHAF